MLAKHCKSQACHRSGPRKPSAMLVTKRYCQSLPRKDGEGQARMMLTKQECFLAMCGQTQPSKDHASASQATAVLVKNTSSQATAVLVKTRAVLSECEQSEPSKGSARCKASKRGARQERAASGQETSVFAKHRRSRACQQERC